jgi:hypothetical protein
MPDFHLQVEDSHFGFNWQSMFSSIARTEMHDAWTHVTLADVYLAQGRYKKANEALLKFA